MTMPFLLHVEGINLAYFIDDTDDLSTIRGGSQLLLEAVGHVKDWLKIRDAGAMPLSTGASAGLFRIHAANEDEANQLVAELREELATVAVYAHATFALACAPEKEANAFRQTRERLLAAIRLEQMQSSTFSLAHELFAGKEAVVCEEDGVRPVMSVNVTEKAAISERERRKSLSVFTRRQHGRVQRQRFYGEQCDDGVSNLRFSDDFNEIGEWKDRQHAEDDPNQNLIGKMAVLYFDGNKFSRFNQADSPEQLETWDKTIKGLRRKLLCGLLESIDQGDGQNRLWWNLRNETDEEGHHIKKLRFETLLWGGDEILWVVPAWRGLWVLDYVLKQTQCWSHHGTPLRHAFGLVFCHCKAPIRRIKALAMRLAEQGKSVLGQDPDHNVVGWTVLESFDHAGVDLQAYFKRRYGLRFDDLCLLDPKPGKAGELARLKDLQGCVPRSVAYDAAASHIALLRDPLGSDAVLKDVTDTVTKARRSCPDRLDDELLEAEPYRSFDAVLATLSRNAAQWVRLVELWDYLEDYEPYEPRAQGGAVA